MTAIPVEQTQFRTFRIVFDPKNPDLFDQETRDRFTFRHKPKLTGVGRGNTGDWGAVRRGKLIGSFRGPGSKKLAIKRAGSNRVLF